MCACVCGGGGGWGVGGEGWVVIELLVKVETKKAGVVSLPNVFRRRSTASRVRAVQELEWWCVCGYVRLFVPGALRATSQAVIGFGFQTVSSQLV